MLGHYNPDMNPAFIAAPAAIAVGAAAYGARYPTAQIFGRTIFRLDSPRKLAITFDDGPNPAITPRLLDVLGRYEARATFFVIGQFAHACRDLLQEIVARGHTIGNHTETHPNLLFLGPRGVRDQIRRCDDAIASALGTRAKWFRPPFGMRNPWLAAAAREFNLSVVMWTLLPGDWRARSDPWLIRRLRPIQQRTERRLSQPHRHARQCGEILCLHDGDHRHLNGDRAHTLAAIEYWLPRWRDLGLEFVTIDDAVRAAA
jgi:peptidoglycan/xylan/chitin deacetylase (PgdA/CDA1 family)